MGPRVLILGLVLVSTGSAFRQVSRNSVLVRPARALATRQGMPVPRAAGHGCLLTLRASGTPSTPGGNAGVGGLSKAEQADQVRSLRHSLHPASDVPLIEEGTELTLAS